MPMSNVSFESPFASFTDEYITSNYTYQTTRIVTLSQQNDAAIQTNGCSPKYKVTPHSVQMNFQTSRKVPKTGVMLVGWGGNNGTTFTAMILANKHKLSWEVKKGLCTANYYGSLVKSSTACLGILPEMDSNGQAVKLCVPLCEMMPFLDPDTIELDGWDISSLNMADSLKRAQVLDVELQKQLYPLMAGMQPRPSIFHPDFVASNQSERADNILKGSLKEMVEKVRADIRDFKSKKGLDKVIVMWTASTERFTELIFGVHDSAAGLLRVINADMVDAISPSTLFAVASILEGCSFINGSPQNTIYNGVIELAEQRGVHVAGDDFKTGQTKIKSSLVEFLIGSGLKPVSIVSYNHLGNNDGKNLASPPQFRSKEISKSGVIEDMVLSNPVLYRTHEKPDHCIVIKYVPYVGDSKRAMDEYTSEICMNGLNTIAMHNTCEDSLLACTVMLDLILMCELFQRISVRVHPSTSDSSSLDASTTFQHFNTVLSSLGLFLKAPLTVRGEPPLNAFSAQRSCIENILRACLGIPPQNNMWLEFSLPETGGKF